MKRAMLIIVGVILITLSAGIVLAAENRFAFSDKTVKDAQTGLTWTRDGNLGMSNWSKAIELVNGLNKNKYAGFTDWRLPSKEELQTLSTYAAGLGFDGGLKSSESGKEVFLFFNTMGFHNIKSGRYWSATGYANNDKNAWVMSSSNGLLFEEEKFYRYNFIWPVRSGQ